MTQYFTSNNLKRFSVVTIILFITFNIDSQEKSISGRISNDLEEKLEGVSIWVKETNINAITDCKGEFEINAKFGDTLIFSKQGYFTEKLQIRNRRKIKLVISFNYDLCIEIFENDSTIEKSINCQPLFIIDGKACKSASNGSLSKEDVKSVIVIKGRKATDKFGYYAANGAIWITTKCKSNIDN